MNKTAGLTALIVLASCAPKSSLVPETPPEKIRVAIADLESKESLGGPALAESVREHLQDRLFMARRYEILERRHLDRALEEAGDRSLVKAGHIVGADWIVYGVITQEHGGAHVHLRVIRVDTGTIIYSGSRLVGMTDAGSSSRGARSAVDEMVREFTFLPQ